MVKLLALASVAVGVVAAVRSTADAGPTSPLVAESRFVRGGAEYRIRAEKFAVTTEQQWGVRIAYRVWRDGRFLHPQDPNGGRQVAPVFQSEQTTPIDLVPFPDAADPVGWCIRSGYGNGMHPNDLAVVVLPDRETYGETTWEWTSFGGWKVVGSGENAEVWTRARLEGNSSSATAWLPERRRLSQHGTVLERTPLDADFRTWPEGWAEDLFPSAFLAGLHQENPAVMRAALERWTPGHARWCEVFGMPGDHATLSALTDAVEDLVRARERIRALRTRGPQGDSVVGTAPSR